MNERLPEVESKAMTTSIAVIEATADALAEKQRELDKAKAMIAQMENLLRDGLTAAEGAETTMRAWAEYEVGTDAFNNNNFCRLLDWQKSVKLAIPNRDER